MTSQSLEPPPFQEGSSCSVCTAVFTTFKRRHHCRCCGKSVCGEHGNKTKPLPQFGLKKPERVCDDCFLLPEESHAAPKRSSPPEKAFVSYDVETTSKGALRVESDDNSKGSAITNRLEELRLPSFECTCGMPLCICEPPVALQPSPSPMTEVSTTPKPRRAPVSTTSLLDSSYAHTRQASGLPSLFFTHGAGASRPDALRTYESDGEGLREAVKNGDFAGVKYLLGQGISPNYCDRQKMSLLHLAAMFNRTDIAFSLMEAGASLTTKNAQGETPLDCAPATLARKMQEWSPTTEAT